VFGARPTPQRQRFAGRPAINIEAGRKCD